MMEDDELSQQRRPGAKPNSVPFTVPENRLLSELYLANKAQYHAKSRVVVGEKNGETSQERFASQFASELTKLGFAHRTSAQVKQRIADIRKLGHKLIVKEKEKDSENKKRKKVFVEPWLRNVMDALAEEIGETQVSGQKRSQMEEEEEEEMDTMSAMAQSLLDNHKQKNREKKGKRKKSIKNGSIERAISVDANSPSTSDVPVENGGNDVVLEDPGESSFFSSGGLPSSSNDSTSMKRYSLDFFTVLQHKLVETQLRVALKKERLLDLKIRKMEVELALETEAQKIQMGHHQNGGSSEDDDSDNGGDCWKEEIPVGSLVEKLLKKIDDGSE